MVRLLTYYPNSNGVPRAGDLRVRSGILIINHNDLL